MNCIDCGVQFNKTGQNHKRCSICSNNRKKFHIKQWAIKNGIFKGVGSGSVKGINASYYKHGLCIFKRWAKEKLVALNYLCERCGNTIDASKRGTWAGHHKDHDRTNNVEGNLEVLCKRCHQIEHECWNAFEGVTTIPTGSTQEIVEAHPTLIG